MLTLHGSPISNYHNKVKLALLEKGIAFQEQHVSLRNKDEASLLGKIPYLSTSRAACARAR